MQHFELHLLRQRGRKALHIELLRSEAHRLDKQLMPLFVRKKHDLAFNRRAISRSDTLNDARIERAAVEIFADDRVRCFICIGQITDGAVFNGQLGLKRKGDRLLVPRLQLHL